jgi:pimeloyl-ACP methyl ester carboxylesterase
MYLKRALVGLVVLAVGVAVAPGQAGATTPGGGVTSTGDAAATATPKLVWGACPPSELDFPRDPRLTCAALTVPLDYRNPRGRTLTVEVSRITTATPASRHGILLSNPGGPGGPGLDLPSVLAALLPAQVVDQYDLIGFDPRGIGYSTPVTCGLSATPDPTLTLPYPAPDGSIARNVAYARATAAACAGASGDLMPFITTANTARDMDRIRAALGEPKLSYYGVSYGTYLGGVFTSLFPGRSDRIVLDSSVDPQVVWYNMWRTWSAGVALRLPDFTAWAAARDDTYHLGASPQAVDALFTALTTALDRDPVPLGNGLTLDGNLLRELTRGLLYADANFPILAQDWQLARQVVGGGAAADPGAMARALASAVGPRPSAGVLAGAVPADNQVSALYSVVCDDAAWPRDVDRYARNVAADRRAFPDTAGMPANMWPCAAWPTRPVEPPVRVTDRGPRDVLMLQNTRDPATPLVSALGMRASLGRRAAMILVDEGGHGVFGLGSCADQVAIDYLATGQLPASDRFCPAPAAGAAPRAAMPAPGGPRVIPAGPLAAVAAPGGPALW